MTLPPTVRAVTAPRQRSRLLRRPALAALTLAGAYAAIGIAYIIFSSDLAAAFSRNVTELQAIEELKGVAFVVVTSLALFGLVFTGLRRIARHEQEADAHLEALAIAEQRALAGMLASSVAHDIRNALSVTTSEIELVLDSGSLSTDDRAALDAVAAANERVIALTRRLSQLGRERMGGEPNEPFDLARALRELAKTCQHHPAVRGHRCEVTGLDTPCPVVGNPLLIARAVTNLILNAAEATPPPGRLRLALERVEPEVVEVHVDDSGPGIPMAEREHVFAPFHTTKPAGTGVGLLSVRLCAEHHGGAAWAEESPLGGARFVIRMRTAPRDPRRTGDVS